MDKKNIIVQLTAAYKKTLNVKSKWFSQDLQDFKSNCEKCSLIDLQTKLNNLNAMNDRNSGFTKTVKQEQHKMEVNGMFNLDK